jgi:hypothetical protein
VSAADELDAAHLATAVLAAAANGDGAGMRVLLSDVPRRLLVDLVDYMATLAISGWTAACGEDQEAVRVLIAECVIEAASG